MYKTGTSGNPAGRPRGAKGKYNKDIKALLNKIVIDNLPQIQTDLAALQPRERLQIIEKFISYLVPKAAKIDVSALNDTDIDRIIENL